MIESKILIMFLLPHILHGQFENESWSLFKYIWFFYFPDPMSAHFQKLIIFFSQIYYGEYEREKILLKFAKIGWLKKELSFKNNTFCP